VIARALPVLRPLATIGILGGGQLGRMLALAASKLGLRAHAYTPDRDSPVLDVVGRATIADYADEAALERFARGVDVITYEFENVPADTAAFLASRRPVIPDPTVLAMTQDRLVEKNFIAGLGIATAAFNAVNDPQDLASAICHLGCPAVLKTRRFGYDGKGQATVRSQHDIDDAWAAIGSAAAIVETYVAFEREISVVAARSHDGRVECFDVTENEHRDRILKVSRVPAPIPAALAAQARRVAEAIAQAFDYVGVLAIEMFVVREGERHAILVNEIAPRVHNSGHWTLDAASVSQFEQHIRAVAGWPLATPIRYGRVETINLIGTEVEDAMAWLAVPNASLHLYGKIGMRAGRKMGHVTRVSCGPAS
jgi:5-(carboxyamino)imidazole ribonucleotide synthase